MAAADNEPTEATTAETRPSDDTPIGTAGVPTTPIREYLQFSGVATGGEVPPPMGRDHAYTAEGIRKLDAALASLVEQKRDSDARAALDGFQDVAERIQKDPTSTEHAGQGARRVHQSRRGAGFAGRCRVNWSTAVDRGVD